MSWWDPKVSTKRRSCGGGGGGRSPGTRPQRRRRLTKSVRAAAACLALRSSSSLLSDRWVTRPQTMFWFLLQSLLAGCGRVNPRVQCPAEANARLRSSSHETLLLGLAPNAVCSWEERKSSTRSSLNRFTRQVQVFNTMRVPVSSTELRGLAGRGQRAVAISHGRWAQLQTPGKSTGPVLVHADMIDPDTCAPYVQLYLCCTFAVLLLCSCCALAVRLLYFYCTTAVLLLYVIFSPNQCQNCHPEGSNSSRKVGLERIIIKEVPIGTPKFLPCH